jgi:hypothetical protein
MDRIRATVRNGLRALAVVGGLALGLAVASPAQAQMMGGMGRLLEPPVNSEDIKNLNELLDIPEGQQEVIDDLFQGFMLKHERAKETLLDIFRKAQKEAEETRDFSVWRDVQIKAIEFIEYQQSIVDDLFMDVKLTLSDERLERWPAFERLHRRAHVLDSGQNIISGSTVDVVRVVDDVDLSEDLSDLTERYATELDRLLVKRQDMTKEHLEKSAEIMSEGEGWMSGMDKWAELFNEGRELEAEILDLNNRYARLVEARLQGDDRVAFEREFNRRAMPAVYGESYVDKAFEATMGIESLSPDQREQATELLSNYRREAGAIQSEWASALEKWQTSAEMMEMFGGQRSGNQETEQHKTAKKELDERYYERLREILTESQVALLPEREQTDWRKSTAFGD